MIQEAIQKIEELTKKAMTAQVIQVPERKGVYLLQKPDGTAEMMVADPSWHNEVLDTPEELVRFIKDDIANGGGDANTAAIFYSEQFINFVYSLEDRRDIATCMLKQSPQYQWLAKFGGQPMTQASLVRALRIDFRGCLQHEGFLTVVRNLKWAVNSDGERAIQHGRESMGKNLIAELKGEAAIPEETALLVPVFDNWNGRKLVRCAVEIDPANQSFAITPYPQEMKTAMDDTLADIAEAFEAIEGLGVYRGRP